MNRLLFILVILLLAKLAHSLPKDTDFGIKLKRTFILETQPLIRDVVVRELSAPRIISVDEGRWTHTFNFFVEQQHCPKLVRFCHIVVFDAVVDEVDGEGQQVRRTIRNIVSNPFSKEVGARQWFQSLQNRLKYAGKRLRFTGEERHLYVNYGEELRLWLVESDEIGKQLEGIKLNETPILYKIPSLYTYSNYVTDAAKDFEEVTIDTPFDDADYYFTAPATNDFIVKVNNPKHHWEER